MTRELSRTRRAAIAATVCAALIGALLALALGVASPTVAGAATAKNPILLTHGLTADSLSWLPFEARLQADGYRVYTVDIPNRGFGDIAQNAKTVQAKVAQIRSETGAAKVDLIGHSEGGLENRYYLKYLGGASVVERYVSLGTPNYGTYMANIINFYPINQICVACEEMTTGSSFLANLNSVDDTPGTVKYTAIYTNYDELVRPVTNAALRNGSTNKSLQSICPWRVVGHIGLVLDGSVYQMARAALRDQTPSTSNVNCWAV